MHTKKKEPGKKGDPDSSTKSNSLQDVIKNKPGQSSVHQIEQITKNPEELVSDLQKQMIEFKIQIEELRQANVAIKESRDHYLDLYESAPLGYITLTDTAIISQANLTATTLLGTDPKRLVNSSFRVWIAPEDRELWDNYFANLLETEKNPPVTCMLVRDDGILFPARLESTKVARNPDNISIRVSISNISDIRLIERELQISEGRLRRAIKNAQVTAAIQDNNLVYQWVYNLRIISPERMIGMKDTDLFSPDDAKNLIHLKRRALETGKEVNEKLWITINGIRIFFDIYVEPLFDKSGRITGIGITTIDLTERKLIEDALKHSEENLQRTQEILEVVTKGTDVIIAAQDINFRYIFFNQGYKDEIKRITGKDLVLGSSMIDIFKDNPDEQKVAICEWKRVFNGENVNQQVEFGTSDKYRRIYHVLHTPIRNGQGKIIGAGEVAYDVTNRVQVDEELWDTKEYLNNLITYANAPIIVWDPQFRITLFNRAFEELSGRKEKDVIGKQLDILFHEHDFAPPGGLIEKTADKERWESVEIPILHINGSIRTVLWNSAYILGSDGKTIVSTIAQGQDITERKKMRLNSDSGLKNLRN